MKTKGIAYSQVKAKGLMNKDAFESYIAEKKKEELQELPINMRKKAGIDSTEVEITSLEIVRLS